jgi:hypothetical protein
MRLSPVVAPLFLALSAVLCTSTVHAAAVPTVDNGCALLHCAVPVASCAFSLFDRSCARERACVETDCPKDDVEGYERCNVQCMVDGGSSKFLSLMTCLADSGCLRRPDVEAPAALAPNAALVDVTDAEFTGTWSVVRGLHRSRDCWNDNTLDFTPTTPDHFAIAWSFTVDSGKRAQGKSEAVRIDAGRFEATNEAFGLTTVDAWTILSRPAPDHLLAYYVGESEASVHRGAYLLAREACVEVTSEVLATVEHDLAAAGLAVVVDDLCVPTHAECR